MKVNILKENVTLTGLTRYLNESHRFIKQSRSNFNTNDVFQYIRLGHLPEYMGGNIIEISKVKSDIKLYNLLENGRETV